MIEGIAVQVDATAVVVAAARPLTVISSAINTLVVVEAAPAPAALVNLVMTTTEVKALTLAEAGVSRWLEERR